MKINIEIPVITASPEAVFFEDEEGERYLKEEDRTISKWKNIINSKMHTFRGAMFRDPESNQQIIITRSLYHEMRWQISYIGSDGIPNMHEEYEMSNDDALFSRLALYSLKKKITAEAVYEN